MNSLQITKKGERFLFVRQLCLAFSERNPYFFYLFLFFCAVIFFASAFAPCIYGTAGARHNVRSLKKGDQCSHLGKTIDALIIGDNF